MSENSVLLRLKELQLDIIRIERHGSAYAPLVRDISFSLSRGESVCLVGESGCGKSITSLSIMGLLPPSLFRIAAGDIIFRGNSIITEEAVRKVRGSRIGMVFQEPMTALNPVFTIGFQIEEAVRLHLADLSDSEVSERVEMLLAQVGMPDPAAAATAYPHQLSGGLRQRAMIAIALSCDPDLLIADEPTTALDVTIQAQILDLLASLQEERGLGLLLVTHNLGVVAQVAHRVLIMYAGRIVEEAPVKELFKRPLHPYTEGLLASVPYSASGIGTRRLHSIPGSVPPLDALPQGCAFQDRCPRVMDVCRKDVPGFLQPEEGRRVACHLYG
jgi:oligopeptide/dipeptide ABC transporter ATP-binding protein